MSDIQRGHHHIKFQVTRHKIVDMLCEIEAARQYGYYCAWLFDQDRNPAQEVSIAKIVSTEMALRVIDAFRQHGVERVDVLAYGTEEDFCEELGFKRSTGLVAMQLTPD